MNLALLDLAERGWTQVEELGDVLLARRINLILGGPLVAPWTVRDLPDVTIDAILSMERLGEIQAGKRKVESYLQAWREKHPGYRRH